MLDGGEGSKTACGIGYIVRTYLGVVAIGYECMAIHCIMIEILVSRCVTATH